MYDIPGKCGGELIGICSGGPAHHPNCGGDVPLETCTQMVPHGPHPWLRQEAGPDGWVAREKMQCPGVGDAAPAEPDTDWLMAWASGWLAGYATGYDHGSADGEARYGAELAAALDPMRRAAVHGIDVALAREAWAEHQARMKRR